MNHSTLQRGMLHTAAEGETATKVFFLRFKYRSVGGRRPGAGDIVLIPPTNDVRVVLAGKSLPALLLLPAACQQRSAQLAAAAPHHQHVPKPEQPSQPRGRGGCSSQPQDAQAVLKESLVHTVHDGCLRLSQHFFLIRPLF